MPNLCHFVARYVKNVVKHAKVGICAGNINVVDISSGGEPESFGDRFKMVLPYAGQYVTWEIIFNSCYPEYPPEIILGSDDGDFNPDIENLKSYCSWRSDNDLSLLITLRELMTEYKSYQLSLLSGSRLDFDYSCLLDETSGCCPDDIEVFVTRRNGLSCGAVRFLIRLDVDFSKIPDYLMRSAGGAGGGTGGGVGGGHDDMALLLVTYQNLDGGTVTPQMMFSPRLERLFSYQGGIRVLPFPHEGCLMDYVPAVREHLQKAVQLIISNFEKKKEYVAAFVTLFGSQVVEFDSIGYSKVVCVFEWQHFRFLLSVELGSKFPSEQPAMTFQSLYHSKADGFPYSKTFNRYPYSPRWDCNEMAERTKAFVLSTIAGFQKDSIQDGLN